MFAQAPLTNHGHICMFRDAGPGMAAPNNLIVAAHRALYRATQEGRDRACRASELIAAAS